MANWHSTPKEVPMASHHSANSWFHDESGTKPNMTTVTTMLFMTGASEGIR